jgi:hypothetical protein
VFHWLIDAILIGPQPAPSPPQHDRVKSDIWGSTGSSGREESEGCPVVVLTCPEETVMHTSRRIVQFRTALGVVLALLQGTLGAGCAGAVERRHADERRHHHPQRVGVGLRRQRVHLALTTEAGEYGLPIAFDPNRT